jgi:TatD DNase family protein
VHPHDSGKATENTYKLFRELAKNPKVVAVGETGLDYYYDHSPRDVQKSVFEEQLKLADSFNLPVALHVRDAYAEALEILKVNKKYINNGILLHCYSGSAETVKEFSQFDAYFSFGGPVTFKTAKKEEVIKAVPTNRLLTETDSPYLTPEPFRGRLNQPAYVRFVLQKVAEALRKDFDETADMIKENTLRLFKRIKI